MTEPSQYFKGRTVQEQMNEVIGYVDTRAAEVASTAIASDVAQVHQDMLDADADASAAAASAAAAAGTLTNAVKKTGEASQSIESDIIIRGATSVRSLSVETHSALTDVTVSGKINVPTPTENGYAANKKYVDDMDALDVHLAGSEAITGAKTVPLEATGTFSNQIASSNKVNNELDNYAPMIRTTGNQTSTGDKTHNGELIVVGAALWQPRFKLKTSNFHQATPPASTVYGQGITWVDAENEEVARIYVQQLSNGKFELYAAVKDATNTYQTVKLI